MHEPTTSRDQAFENLTREFPRVSVRVVLAIFLRYLDTDRTLTQAVHATRVRLIDACAEAA